ncbi:hypothetical protein [Schaalia vaccimaxillae]|uniref:hypothetical protein n=1 Tax=Schaalia vaccimaxillae TaxID=183916 RepID=UPI0003B3B7AE|nr:hypothetical protein [Schaalia vaccimaxillae]
MTHLLFEDTDALELMVERHAEIAERINSQAPSMPENVDGGVLESHILTALAKIASNYGVLSTWSASMSMALDAAKNATIAQDEQIADSFSMEVE